MFSRMKRCPLPLLLLAVAATASAQTPAERTFDALKKLVGTWQEGEGKKSFRVVYRLTGDGTTLMETQFPDTAMEMVSVYHLDGKDKLILTHYCAAHNQPTMALIPGATDKEFRFDFVSGSNMKPTDSHIHNVRYRLLAKDHIVSEWGGYANGKPSGAPTKFDLRRVKA